MNELVTIFKKAEDYVQRGLAREQFSDSNDTLSNDVKLKFYSLYKVATCGSNNTEKPSFFDFVGKAKWNAWTEASHLSQEEAMAEYIKLLDELAPGWLEFYNNFIK